MSEQESGIVLTDPRDQEEVRRALQKEAAAHRQIAQAKQARANVIQRAIDRNRAKR